MIIKENLNIYLNSAGKVAQLLRDILAMENEIDRDKEHFWVIGLNVKNRVMFIDLCTLGILDRSLVHPREVFRLAISKGVAWIIVGHNHPSCDPEPSEDDVKITKKLAEAGKILGIDLIDHVIIAGDSHVSLASMGVI